MKTTTGNGMFLYLDTNMIVVMIILISIFYNMNLNVLLVCQDISTMCKAFATEKNCATKAQIQKRCQKSCNRCRKYILTYNSVDINKSCFLLFLMKTRLIVITFMQNLVCKTTADCPLNEQVCIKDGFCEGTKLLKFY